MSQSTQSGSRDFSNVAISGLGGVASSSQNSSPNLSETQPEPEVSLVSQIASDGQTPVSLDNEVKALLRDAVGIASKRVESFGLAKPVKTQSEVVMQPESELQQEPEPAASLTFNALAAFVAGLAVVGIVYAFAVQGGLVKYKSVVLGDSIESSR
ncbi:hypothetical protein COV25_02720 [candidate division WWE3 bacterium CG10_big_fil_rev_8_21_14_0_10_35_32]|nr:MAG: hypothetical protein COV25_02720 [candidate division WWE3 bacterium CG10_big_fil_rev_8_21_14_0_10_35_32]